MLASVIVLCCCLLQKVSGDGLMVLPMKPGLPLPEESLIIGIQVLTGETHVITSPNYPQKYYPPTSVGWIFSCPKGYGCQLNCTDVDLPCDTDKLEYYVPGVGHELKEYCGINSTVIRAGKSKMSLALEANLESKGGKFSCRLSAYRLATCICGCRFNKKVKYPEFEDRLDRGVTSSIPEFSMIAGVKYEGYPLHYLCAAAIIRDDCLVTAAECTIGRNIKFVAVEVGPYDVASGIMLGPKFEVKEMTQVLQHEGERPEGDTSYEIGFILLNKKIEFNQYVYPACISLREENFVGQMIKIVGWDYINHLTKKALVNTDVLVVSDKTCEKVYNEFSSKRSICTYSKVSDHLNAPGPMFITDPHDSRMYLVGFADHKYYNTEVPEYHTKIVPVSRWIFPDRPWAEQFKYNYSKIV